MFIKDAPHIKMRQPSADGIFYPAIPEVIVVILASIIALILQETCS